MDASTIILILFVTVTIGMVQSRPASVTGSFASTHELGQSVDGLRHVKHYLERFGYLSYTNYRRNNTTNRPTEYDELDDVLESAIKQFQLTYGLPVTGEPDSRTMSQIMKPRCGVPDHMINTTEDGYHTDYKLQPGRPRWHKSKLRYKFLPDSRFPKVNYRSAVARAFRTWEKVTNLKFKKKGYASTAELELGFYSGKHDDRLPFDGPGGVLGHTFSPPVGVTHFDSDEPWTCSAHPGSQRLDLESVALHELGHALGLDHSSHHQAVMYPFFSYGQTKRKLYRDDIEGIRTLYGLP